MTLDQEIRGIVADQLGKSIEDITAEASLDSLGADSLDTVEVLMRVEERYNLVIPEAEKLTTVGQLITYVEGRYQPQEAYGT